MTINQHQEKKGPPGSKGKEWGPSGPPGSKGKEWATSAKESQRPNLQKEEVSPAKAA